MDEHILEKKAKEFKELIKGTYTYLENYSDLIDEDVIKKIKHLGKEFDKISAQSQDEARKLSIGVIGQIKAGKSTFLNALLFEGHTVLPQAATPMTAALTRINYAPIQKAVIHFYEREDWLDITEGAEKYDKKIRNEYNKYCDDWKKNAAKRDVKELGSPKPLEQFAKEQESKIVDERLCGYKQLTEMAKEIDVEEYLGKSEEVSFETMEDLTEYIGAKGKFTPIVNYVELEINNPALDGLEIIDTPGLNDPIVSRGNKTKEFLEQCDVAILLSPVFQFLPTDTMNSICHMLPSAGINNFLIVGSKMDMGLSNENPKTKVDFTAMYKHLRTNYGNDLKNNIEKSEMLSQKAKLLERRTLFISSVFYAAALKVRNGEDFNSEEQKSFDNISKRYTGFTADYETLMKFSGFGAVKKALNEILEEKSNIIAEKNSGTVRRYMDRVISELEDEISAAANSQDSLKSNEISDLEKRAKASRTAIDKSRGFIREIFLAAANDSKARMEVIKGRICGEVKEYSDFKTAKRTDHKDGSYKEGWLIFKTTKHYTYDEIHTTASTADIDANLMSYIGRCREIISEEFKYIVGKEDIKREITDVMLHSFQSSGCDFEENDVRLPLKRIFSEIEIPEVDLKANIYIDMLHTLFYSSYAEDEQIHELRKCFTNVMSKITDDVEEELDKRCKEITDILAKEASTFSDSVEKKISGELDRLTKLAADKMTNLRRYDELITVMKADVRKYTEE